MNEHENLFGTPAEGIGDPFAGFDDLGSMPDSENPFADPVTPPAEAVPQAEVTVEEVIPQQETPALEVTPPAAPTVPTAPAAQPKTPPSEPDDPLTAGLKELDKKNDQLAAQSVMTDPPVFSYNGSEEAVTDTDQTFDQLREAKATDFPEFDEAKSVSWNVVYGTVTKLVTTPAKSKISEFKREIEGSKQFLDALKKSKDKHPKCLLKPRVTMQKKGIAAYKGIFPRLEEARASDKTICIVPARDGKVYELRRTGVGEFITGTDDVPELSAVSPGFTPGLPFIPYELFEQIVSLFRYFLPSNMTKPPMEVLVQVYWDSIEERYFVHVPEQTVTPVRISATVDAEDLQDEDRYLLYADIHSHNVMAPKFSATDDADERANRIYMVVGHLDRYYPEVTARVCNGGHFLPIDPNEVLETRPRPMFPDDWLDRIHACGADDEEVAA